MSKIKDYAMPAIVLFVICLVATSLLAVTNNVTAPKIEELAYKTELESRQKVFEAAASFGDEIATSHENTSVVPALDESGNTIGYVVVNSENGYGGAITVMTGVDLEGKVTGINILDMSETAGLGANASKQSFKDQFVGLVEGIAVSKDRPGENSIDALTGATITSRAVVRAVNAAIEAGGEING